MIDAGHMNVYLIILGIVYHLTKLQKVVKYDHLGQDKEFKLIEFLTQFGYATRKSPTVRLHAAHTYDCSDINETKLRQGCDNIHSIITVTLFLVLIYYACITFQHDKTTNLLISALDCFDLGTTIDGDTFMTTISKSTNTMLISKQEFHSIINNFAFTQFFTLHSFIYSWAFLVRSQKQIISQLKLPKQLQWNRSWGNVYLPAIHSLLAFLWIGEGIVCIWPTTTNMVWHI